MIEIVSNNTVVSGHGLEEETGAVEMAEEERKLREKYGSESEELGQGEAALQAARAQVPQGYGCCGHRREE